jgi:hypothetical protein
MREFKRKCRCGYEIETEYDGKVWAIKCPECGELHWLLE